MSLCGHGPLVTHPFYGPWYMNFDLGLFKNFQLSESRKLQLRLNGYNFLNHPLYSFSPQLNNLILNFTDSGPKQGLNQNADFGISTVKQGHRIVQVALKFCF